MKEFSVFDIIMSWAIIEFEIKIELWKRDAYTKLGLTANVYRESKLSSGWSRESYIELLSIMNKAQKQQVLFSLLNSYRSLVPTEERVNKTFLRWLQERGVYQDNDVELNFSGGKIIMQSELGEFIFETDQIKSW